MTSANKTYSHQLLPIPRTFDGEDGLRCLYDSLARFGRLGYRVAATLPSGEDEVIIILEAEETGSDNPGRASMDHIRAVPGA